MAGAEIISAYALTEANSGSDALAAQARAELSEDGTHYVLNGEKTFISNGAWADVIIVFAKIDGDKFSAFIVERDFGGVSHGAEERKMGIHGSSTVQLYLENTKVPVENLLGEVGKGHKIAFNILNVGRFKLGVGCLGGAKQAFDDTVKYCLERKQFGQPIIQFGMMKNKVADMASRIHAVEAMSYRTAGLLDGILEPIDKNADDAPELTMAGIFEYVTECSILKVKGSEMLDYVVDEAVQMLGGYGYLEDYPIERYYRDSRIARIYEGTNEINRMLIPGQLIKKAMKGDLPLMAAAQKLQAELMELPSFDEDEDTTLMAEEAKLITNVKKTALLTAGVAVQKYMTELDSQQGVLGRIADIIIEAYSMESAYLRTMKYAKTHDEEAAQHLVDMTRLYVYDTIGRVDLWAREALAACAEGDELRTMLAGMRRLTKYTPIDAMALRERIADYFIAKEKFEV